MNSMMSTAFEARLRQTCVLVLARSERAVAGFHRIPQPSQSKGGDMDEPSESEATRAQTGGLGEKKAHGLAGDGAS